MTIPKDRYFNNSIWEKLRDRQECSQGSSPMVWLATLYLAAGGAARSAQANFASGQFFDRLGLYATIGRTFTIADDRPGCPGTAVLRYSFWQREYGGHADAVGQTTSLNHPPFAILGVIGPGFTRVDVGNDRDLYVPVCTEKIIIGETSELGPFRVIGRLKPGISVSQAQARLRTLALGLRSHGTTEELETGSAGQLSETFVRHPVGHQRTFLYSYGIPAGADGTDGDRGSGAADCVCQRGESSIGAAEADCDSPS